MIAIHGMAECDNNLGNCGRNLYLGKQKLSVNKDNVMLVAIKVHAATKKAIKIGQNGWITYIAKNKPKARIVCCSILRDKFFELLASTFESLSSFGVAIGDILFAVWSTVKCVLLPASWKFCSIEPPCGTITAALFVIFGNFEMAKKIFPHHGLVFSTFIHFCVVLSFRTPNQSCQNKIQIELLSEAS